jgi:uncharacterized protein (TIGR02598 family)
LKQSGASGGFSLVEITLALGITAVCLIAIFGLLPIGIQANRNATEQTHSLAVLSAVSADLRATPGTGGGTSQQFKITIPSDPSTASGDLTLYFDEHGGFATSLQAVSMYRLVVTFVPNNAGSRGATLVDLRLTWPAAATPANANGSSETFVALDRN